MNESELVDSWNGYPVASGSVEEMSAKRKKYNERSQADRYYVRPKA